MYDSPGSLQDVCVDFICENLETLCDRSHNLPLMNKFEPSPDDSSCEEYRQVEKNSSNGIRLMFKGSEVFLHTVIAEQLLTALCAKKKLSDITMTLFDVTTTRLR